MTEDDFKGYFHAAIATAVGVALGYNAMRFAAARHRRNGINVALYVPVLIHEWRQVRHHFSQPRTVPGWDRPLSADDV